MKIDVSVTDTRWLDAFQAEPVKMPSMGDFGEIFKKLSSTQRHGDPLFEIFMEISHRGLNYSADYHWTWGQKELYPRDYRSAYMADEEKCYFAKVSLESHTSNRDMNNPWDNGNLRNGVVYLDIQGHGNGKAISQTHTWRLSPLARHFMDELEPLIAAFSSPHDTMQIGVSYTSRLGHNNYLTYTDNRNSLEPRMIMLQVGSFSAFINLVDGTSFDRVCSRIGHHAVHLRPLRLGLMNVREPVFVCNGYTGVSFAFDVEEKLSNLMLGDTPTQEEMFMIEMAGYKKEEFWIDNIPNFDRLRIKPFNLEESTRCYEMTRPRFHI